MTDGADTARFTLVGDYKNSVFTIASDGHGGTTVIDTVKQGHPGKAALLPFIAAAAAFGGAPAAQTSASSAGGREIPPALALPNSHFA